MGWRAKVAEGQAGQADAGQSQLVADLNAPAKGLVEGVGQTVRGAGEKVEAFRRQDAEQRLDIINRTLTGQGMPSPPIGSTGNEPEFAMQAAYADMTPDQLRQAKAGLEARLKDAAPGQQTGQAIVDAAQKAFPVAKQNEGLQTEVLGGVGSMVPALAAGALGGVAAGPAGAIAATGAAMFPQSYDSTYQDALAKGATPDQADAAATRSAAVQSAVQSVPFSRAVAMVPAPLRDGFVKTAMHLAGQGVEFSAANTASTLAENYVAQNTYDPDRPLMQGVAHSAAVGAITGPVVGGAMAGVHGAVQHAIDVAQPIASPTYAAAQAQLRELGGLPPLQDQGAPAAPSQAGSQASPEPAPAPSPSSLSPAPAWRFQAVDHDPFAASPPAGLAEAAAAPTSQQIGVAIHGQESGGSATSATSVDGARGGWQITPATFKQYALPGESIDNARDNSAVGQRIIDDLAGKYGNDPARVAVAYFSGPGNVAPPGSATPWIADKRDGNGKSTASYVGDVLSRLGAPETPTAAGPKPALRNAPGGSSNASPDRQSSLLSSDEPEPQASLAPASAAISPASDDAAKPDTPSPFSMVRPSDLTADPCQSARKRDPLSASKKDPSADADWAARTDVVGTRAVGKRPAGATVKSLAQAGRLSIAAAVAAPSSCWIRRGF